MKCLNQHARYERGECKLFTWVMEKARSFCEFLEGRQKG
jgi:hypothetical protein